MEQENLEETILRQNVRRNSTDTLISRHWDGLSPGSGSAQQIPARGSDFSADRAASPAAPIFRLGQLAASQFRLKASNCSAPLPGGSHQEFGEMINFFFLAAKKQNETWHLE